MEDSIQSQSLMDLIFDLEELFLARYGVPTKIITNWDTDVFSQFPVIKEEIISPDRVYIITNGVHSIKGIYSWN